MKRMRLLSGLFLLTVLLVFSVVGGPLVAAEGFVGISYFEGAGGGFQFTPPGPNGAYSINGSVMPNQDISRDTYAGAGAVGTKALGITMQATNMERKQALYNFLLRKQQSGSEWEKMGSAFIVHEMTGKPWGSGGRNIPPDDPEWAELKARLVDNDDVKMVRRDFARTINTSGVIVNGRYDAVRYDYDDSVLVDAWVLEIDFRPVYVLEVICANPLGNLPGLPPALFSLNPSVSVNPAVIEPEDSVTVTNSVRNGSNTQSGETDWRLTKLEYKPGAALSPADKKGGDSGSDPCAAFTSRGRAACDTVQNSKKEVFNAKSTKTFRPNYIYTAPVTSEAGTKICFAVSVSKPTQASEPVWRHSAMECTVVGKEPKMQVWGGDVRAGGTIDTSISTFSRLGRTYGSWGEYAALSNDRNSGFGSGAGLNKGNVNAAQAKWSSLTFANSGGGASCAFGCYGFTSYAPPLAGQFQAPPSPKLLTGKRSVDGIGPGTYTANDLTITGGTVRPGKTIVIIAAGTVTITGNITYDDGPYAGAADIPQVVILAKTVNIAGTVGVIDSWLLAATPTGTGTINTCSDVAPNAALTVADCNNRLIINGPVVADTIYLRRTAGSAGGMAALDEPAETFNLRADAYVWGSGYGDGSGKVRTVHTKELPPRF